MRTRHGSIPEVWSIQGDTLVAVTPAGKRVDGLEAGARVPVFDPDQPTAPSLVPAGVEQVFEDGAAYKVKTEGGATTNVSFGRVFAAAR